MFLKIMILSADQLQRQIDLQVIIHTMVHLG
jgi:hypothetical protein